MLQLIVTRDIIASTILTSYTKYLLIKQNGTIFSDVEFNLCSYQLCFSNCQKTGSSLVTLLKSYNVTLNITLQIIKKHIRTADNLLVDKARYLWSIKRQFYTFYDRGEALIGSMKGRSMKKYGVMIIFSQFPTELFLRGD